MRPLNLCGGLCGNSLDSPTDGPTRAAEATVPAQCSLNLVTGAAARFFDTGFDSARAAGPRASR